MEGAERVLEQPEFHWFPSAYLTLQCCWYRSAGYNCQIIHDKSLTVKRAELFSEYVELKCCIICRIWICRIELSMEPLTYCAIFNWHVKIVLLAFSVYVKLEFTNHSKIIMVTKAYK